MSRTKSGMMAEVTASAERLNDDEIEVILEVTRGLIVGLGEYGHLNIDADNRCMLTASTEEARDRAAYCAVLAIQQHRLAIESGCESPNQLRRLLADQRSEIDQLRRQLGAGRRSCG